MLSVGSLLRLDKAVFDNILVAVDGSEHSKKAMSYAVELAEKFGASITLIHVYSAILPIIPATDALTSATVAAPASAAVAAKIAEDARKLGERILEDLGKIVKERGIPVEKVLREGDAVKEVVAEARKGGFSLVVIGHRGLSKLSELLLGSVSEGVGHKAPCSVMIVK